MLAPSGRAFAEMDKDRTQFNGMSLPAFDAW